MLSDGSTKPRELTIAVRAFAAPRAKHDDVSGSKKPAYSGGLNKPSKWTIVFDTETTVDEAQTLRFGVYHLYNGRALHEQGLFFEPKPKSSRALAATDFELIKAYASEKGLTIRTTAEFIDRVFYRYGYHYGGSIVGFNLPFDLSRLANHCASARGRMRGGFSFRLHLYKINPPVRIKHLSARASLISFATPPAARDGRGSRKRNLRRPPPRGFFVDVKTLAATLTGASHTLASIAQHLGIKAKFSVSQHGGKITRRYLDYATRDVEVTAEAYFKLADEFKAYSLTKTQAHQLYSEASLGKAILREMGIKPLLEVQPDVPPEIFGRIMSGYFGGRSEVAIRREMARVIYCDFRSMYPTVCTLMGLWRFVIAKGFGWKDATEETIALLERTDLDALLTRDSWKKLTILVKVQPDSDVLPVRAAYNGQTRSIGLNPLVCEQPLWFTLADVIAAWLLSSNDPDKRRVPRIIEAIRFEAKEPQDGLKPLKLQGLADHIVDPQQADLFREVILRRGKVQREAKCATELLRKQQLQGREKNLKLVANSTSYGIFAEVNVNKGDRLQDVACFGPASEPLHTTSKAIEDPGSFFHPLLATLITGAARLMLAIAERLVIDEGLDWALCDTDSLAIARPEGMTEVVFNEKVARARARLAALDPYGDGKDLLKLEDANFDPADGRTIVELYCFAISAKRYALFTIDADGKPILRKASAHGLGHLRPPYQDKEAPDHLPRPQRPLREIGVERWQHDLWLKIIEAALAGHPEQVDLSDLPNIEEPTLSRYSATTPDLLSWFKTFNTDKAWVDQVKPFNFLVAFQVSPTAHARAITDDTFDAAWLKSGGPSPVAPFVKDPKKAPKRCFDRVTGKPVPASLLASYGEALCDYHLHPEAKFLNADLFDRGHTVRQPVRATGVELIGKEANRWEEQFFLGQDEDAQVPYGLLPASDDFHVRLGRFVERFGPSRVADAAGVSRPALTKLVKTKAPPTKRMRAKLEEAFTSLDDVETWEHSRSAETLVRLRQRAADRGLRQLAADLGVHHGNLSAMLAGKRPVSRNVSLRLRP
jgi:plasmid maintenance system antidote protein VapI